MRALPTPGLTLMLALLALLTLAGMGANEPAHAASNLRYRVIVHPKNPITMVDRSFLQDAFLKKTTQWPTGLRLQPVDLHPKAVVRRKFSEEVLARSIAAVKSYWQQRIFSGRGVPPPELQTEHEIITYVLDHEGAVGYVSEDSDLKSSKTVLVKP